VSPREWDAESYDVVAAPMTERGIELVDRLPLEGKETVLDAGCGTGHVTKHLLQRLPGGHVIALDGSEQMLEIARARLGEERATYLHADLGQPLPIDEPVDGIISTSTFHWVDDHDALFANLAAVLRPGGFLSAECGGEGNIESVNRALDDIGVETKRWQFKGIDDTRARLAAAGFVDTHVELVPRPAHIPREQFREYLRTVVLGAYDETVVDAVAERLDEPVLDYVRLVIRATR
jgi:trans-aconitate 2-methyltransferase